MKEGGVSGVCNAGMELPSAVVEETWEERGLEVPGRLGSDRAGGFGDAFQMLTRGRGAGSPLFREVRATDEAGSRVSTDMTLKPTRPDETPRECAGVKKRTGQWPLRHLTFVGLGEDGKPAEQWLATEGGCWTLVLWKPRAERAAGSGDR